MQNDDNPATIYALIVGAGLVFTGIIGFFYEAEFTDDKSVRDSVYHLFDINGWHNLVHLVTGALGLLALAAGAYAARAYALGLGAVYIVLALWGFIVGDGDSILSIIPVNTQDNVLHLLIGLLGIAVGAAKPRGARGPRRTSPLADNRQP